jgi:hypothetical protein
MTFQGNDASGTVVEFPAGTSVAVTNNHHLFNNVVRTEDAQTIAGVKTFSAVPVTTGGNPINDGDLARKAYVDATATGTTNINRVVIAGNAGENVADGNLLYLLEADNEWYKTDADDAAKVEGVLLGIAQGAGTNGNAITGGVLITGLDDAQSGLTQGDPYYASNTAGDITATPGTIRRSVGVAQSETTLIFSPDIENLPTYLQKALLAAITASASELNILDGFTGTTALLNEAATFFGATDISGAEAETLTSGAASNAESLHTHNNLKVGGVTGTKYRFSCNFDSFDTLTDATITAVATWNAWNIESTGATWSAQQSIPGSNSGQTQFADGKEISFEEQYNYEYKISNKSDCELIYK